MGTASLADLWVGYFLVFCPGDFRDDLIDRSPYLLGCLSAAAEELELKYPATKLAPPTEDNPNPGCYLGYYRRLARDLADCPRACHSYVFWRHHGYYLEWMRFNERYQHYCDEQASWHRAFESDWAAAKGEAKRIYDVYNHLDTVSGTYDLCTKRRALRSLLALLGEEDFYSGKVPPPVPLWRFDRR